MVYTSYITHDDLVWFTIFYSLQFAFQFLYIIVLLIDWAWKKFNLRF